jgi:hypothetical protein
MSVLKLNQIQTASGVIMANLNSSGANVGIQLASNLAPAFSAYANGGQSISNNTATKIQFNIENFDTASAYDNATNYRFTPLVAGYYQVTLNVALNTMTGGAQPSIYKTGSVYQYGNYPNTCSSAPWWANMSALIYMNGSTDYLEGFITQFSGSSIALQTSSYANVFSAVLVRSA